MRVIVGSQNQAKLEAVQNALALYDMFTGAEISGKAISSGVSEQPTSLAEIVRGAQNRARGVFRQCDYSVGLESGLMPVPGTKAGYMDVGVCAIYDGKQFHLGLSPAFEPPREVVRLVFEEGHDLGTAAKAAGLTGKDNLGAQEGLVGILTKGRITRSEQVRQSVITAMVHLENIQ
jgi:inosine/xanthosine triphosphatase